MLKKYLESEDKTKFDNLYWSSKAEIVINESNIDDVFQSIYTAIITNRQNSLQKDLSWIIDSVIDHSINISKYNPFPESSDINLPKELDRSRKGLINIQNIHDNECFKWRIVIYSNSADSSRARITKSDKKFAKKFDFNDIKFPEKIKDISLWLWKQRKHPIYESRKCCKEKHVDLLLIEEEGKRNYVLIKDFNTFIYNHSLHRGGQHFCLYCLHPFTTEEVLKCHIKNCFKMNGKQRIVMPKKGEYVTFQNYERKIKSTFIICADFQSILVLQNNGK